MVHLTATEVTLLVAAAGVIGGFFAWIGRGIGFALARWWKKSPTHEHAAYLNTVADLGAKLRSNGMTIDEVRQLEVAIQNPSIASSGAAAQVVEQLVSDPEPRAFQSNYAMKMRTAAACNVAEAKLEQALRDLQLLMGDHEWDAVVKAQEHWQAYRGWLEESAAREFAGGTHAGLASGLASLAETERRTQEILAQMNERAAR
jgi:hypothetical protein